MRLVWPYKGRGEIVAAAALVCALGAAVTTASLAATTRADDTMVELGLAAHTPRIERMPWARQPMPAPARLETPRLKIEMYDGTTLVDVVPFDAHGAPVRKAFDAISSALATSMGARTEVHPRLVELLLTLSLAFDGKPLVLVSGYREPGRGTRRTSYHACGMAADITIRGVKLRDLRAAALRLGATGIGHYPYYLHVDVRQDDTYRWGGR